MSSNNDLQQLTVQELFEKENYLIPIYQRNYAWSKKEIEQLIDDIDDYAKDNKLKHKNYYIGTLVVYERDLGTFEVIDGQQRQTTLFILLNCLKDVTLENRLSFESRESSKNALKKIGDDSFYADEMNQHILTAKEIIDKKLKNVSKTFTGYLLKNVKILRVKVPKDTDLNHYFEIMNNRGEQLEKHEILKSRLLNILKDKPEDRKVFHKIWDACANMDRYVQYGFSPDERSEIFGDNWNTFHAKSFCDIIDKISKEEENGNSSKLKITKILDQVNKKKEKKVEEEKSERFSSVINFSNFLLQVLKIHTKDDIPLDDKRLLDTFGKLKTPDEVKKFAYNLLKIRFLFDNYIIKRDYSKDEDDWSLLQLYKNNNTAYKNRFENEDKNKNILMILAMFHVSSPTLLYKHWLSAALKYLFEQQNRINDKDYLKMLENLAKCYMRDRFLNDEPRDYHDMIFKKTQSENKDLKYDKLDKGTEVENFIFNYLDYLLWKKKKDTEHIKYNEFKFSFRNSVEHYYPQNPMNGISELSKKTLDSFGNLCLITSSENSRLSNFTPEAKKDFYLKQKNISLKQQIMMDYNEWNEVSIQEHQKEMIKMLS